MRLTPRGNEVKAIAAIMESGEFDSPEAMAKAIIKAVAELFSERQWHAWVYRESPDAQYLSYGPFASETEAMKYAGKWVEALKGQHMILPLYSTAELTERMSAYKMPSFYCENCTHSIVSHEHPKIQPKCAVRGCKCKRST